MDLEDWAGSYIERLEPFGLQVPRWIHDAKRHVEWGGHSAAMVSAALWPMHAWRSDYMTEEDFAFLEDKYPGWEEHFGAFWRAYREMADPRKGHLALELFPAMPPICRVCQMPCCSRGPTSTRSGCRSTRPASGTRFARRHASTSSGRPRSGTAV